MNGYSIHGCLNSLGLNLNDVAGGSEGHPLLLNWKEAPPDLGLETVAGAPSQPEGSMWTAGAHTQSKLKWTTPGSQRSLASPSTCFDQHSCIIPTSAQRPFLCLGYLLTYRTSTTPRTLPDGPRPPASLPLSNVDDAVMPPASYITGVIIFYDHAPGPAPQEVDLSALLGQLAQFAPSR